MRRASLGRARKLHRIAAFAAAPGGGNPAGVWVGNALPDPHDMQRIAAEVGYSETAFLAPAGGNDWQVRYFSPEAEVPFCGHATIAAGFVLGAAEAETTYRFATPSGDVAVTARASGDTVTVSLTSVEPRYRPLPQELLGELLSALRWRRDDLDVSIKPALAYAGAWHAVLAAASRERLANLDYDFAAAKSLMAREDLTTLQLIWRETDDLFHARNPFPPGGVVEDPATGAAAAALGGYLREAGYVEAPFDFEIRQGEDMGRPSRLGVSVPAAGGVVVRGTAGIIGAPVP